MKIYIKASTYKRIAHVDEFDNGHVIHNDWMKLSNEAAEDEARKKSMLDPSNIYYVQYDDIMNPSSDNYWVGGECCNSYQQALTIRKKNRGFAS